MASVPVAVLLLLLLGVPLLGAAAAAVGAGLDAGAWQVLWSDPQTARSTGMSLWTGLAASGAALAITAVLLAHHFGSPRWARLVRSLGPLLAVPHAAFAIGLVFLVAPSGWLLRLLSPWATGLEAPPPWPTTQDPWGLGLIAVLVAKEVPFLLWSAATQLQRPEVSRSLQGQWQVARSMGYTPAVAWRRVVWPQLWPSLTWPMLAVLAYNLTVVDVALVIGPTTPPTLAVQAWQWLTDADLAFNAQGAAAAWLLAALVLLVGAAAWPLPRLAVWRAGLTRGTRGRTGVSGIGAIGAISGMGAMAMPVLLAGYGAVMLALAVGSVAGVWPFPAVWPQQVSWAAWASVAASAGTVGTTLGLALASAGAALLWAVAWLEWAPLRWQSALRPAIYLPLLLPAVLWVVGVHALALRWGLDARWPGVWLAHTLGCVPYVLVSLSPAYSGFDPRLGQTAASLGKSRAAFLWQVKWPLLKAALAASLAVGFAVSVAQYLPTLFVGGGRFATVSTEAVTLASGAQRSLTSAYAWLQWLLPALGFALAAWVGKPRRF